MQIGLDTPSSAKAAFYAGMVEIFVVSPSYIPFALVCGVASANVGMTTASALALPALVFGGDADEWVPAGPALVDDQAHGERHDAADDPPQHALGEREVERAARPPPRRSCAARVSSSSCS